jgi:hypothetical protein
MKKTPSTLNEDLKHQYKLYLMWHSNAVKIAIREHDDLTLREIATAARRQHANLSAYLDECEPGVDLDPEILVLADYFRETAEDIEKALKRSPDDDDPSEAWKKEAG